jgi:hypothetical protein
MHSSFVCRRTAGTIPNCITGGDTHGISTSIDARSAFNMRPDRARPAGNGTSDQAFRALTHWKK